MARTWPVEQASRHPLLWVVPMSATELIQGLLSTPEARRIPAAAPISSSVLVARIEVALTSPAPERAFRARWRERHGGGAKPLLLIADDRGQAGCISVLGPTDPTGPIRRVACRTRAGDRYWRYVTAGGDMIDKRGRDAAPH